MPSLHESTDFTGKAALPRRWEDDVFRYCAFENLHLEGQAFEGMLSGCTVSHSSFYWGLFNTTQFIKVEFRDCLFRGSGFAGCIFVQCRFVNCTFAKDNLNGDCAFTDCAWFDCEQEACEGLPDEPGLRAT